MTDSQKALIEHPAPRNPAEAGTLITKLLQEILKHLLKEN